MSFRTKLILAFSGPLAILILLGLVSIRTITMSSHTLQTIFRENYDSVAACLKMKDAIQEMDRTAETFIWEGVKDKRISAEEGKFAENLRFQQGNVTVPGEQELTDALKKQWNVYRTLFEQFFTLSAEGNARRDFYREKLLQQSRLVTDLAQRITDINLHNMVFADGQARRKAAETNRTLMFLVLSGIVLAGLFAGIIWRSMAKSISGLISSVQEIQRGNLDLFVQVNARDEIGNLASAFNEMTSSLRRFRTTNRKELLRSQRATNSLLDTLPEAVAVCNPAGMIELSNQAAAKMFGLTAGGSLKDAGSERIAALFERANREVRPIRSEGWDWAIQKFVGGEEKFFMPEAVPILDDERKVIGVTLLFSDVTRLRKADEVKSGLISTVSHELKTPLTSIRLATHALLNEKLGVLTPKQSELVAAAREESDRLHKIIENLLELGKMESGRSRLDLVSLNAEELLLAAADRVSTAFADRGIAFSVDLPSAPSFVRADNLRLGIVFANLLTNALRHTPPGGEVRLCAQEADSEVIFSVEDTGQGIAEEDLPRIFEKFYRVSGGEEPGASGLGLAIVKEILGEHGSKIEVSSSPGQGARFTFSLKKV
ncbi:MAG: ATP-binding protein [Syntrophobacteraceae bacterium]|nr:ATP-binding protein [Syntrophobacteraceae bacterium]